MLQFKRRLCRSVIALAVLLGVFAAGFSLGQGSRVLLLRCPDSAGFSVQDTVIGLSAAHNIPLYPGFRLFFPSKTYYVDREDYALMTYLLEQEGITAA